MMRRSLPNKAGTPLFALMFEQLVKRNYVFEGRLIRVRVDQVRLNSGANATREIVEHPGAVVIVALDANERVLLVKQYRQAVERETLELPAGTLDKRGEGPAEAARRELLEETGYAAKDWELVTQFFPSPGINTEEMYLYLARDLSEQAQATEEDESITVEILPLSEAIKLVESGEIRDGKTIVGLLLLARKLGM
jgi:ADP-ribose pyrophosphatase